MAEPSEIFFSILQRKALSPNDFTNLDQVQDRQAAFEHRYNRPPGPQHEHQPAPPTAA